MTIIIFFDLHIPSNVVKICNSIRNKSGIYLIINLKNSKIYVGSASDLSNRLRAHARGTKSNIPLQNSIKVHGLNNFVFIIIEFCAIPILYSREQFYMFLFQPEYNIFKLAGSPRGWKHSEKSKKQISEARIGHTPSEQARLNISIAQRGTLNHRFGKSAVNAIIIHVLSVKDNQLVQSFSSQVATAKWLKVNESSVRRYIKSGKPFKNLYYITRKS